MSSSNFDFVNNQLHYKDLLLRYLEQLNETILFEIVKNSKMRFVDSYRYDNWNGGRYDHKVNIEIRKSEFIKLVDIKEKHEANLSKRFNKIYVVENESISVSIVASKEQDELFVCDGGLKFIGDCSIDEANRIWGNTTNLKVFISHRDKHKLVATKLKKSLFQFGISAFVAHEDIEPTKEWVYEIKRALATMDIFIAYMSDDFFESVWTNQEIGVALAMGIPIIPLKQTKAPQGFISAIQALPYKEKNIVNDIIFCLLKDTNTDINLKNKVIDIIIEQFRVVSSWADAEKVWDIIYTIDKLNLQQVENIINAFNSNSQINCCVAISGYNMSGTKKDDDKIIKKLKKWTEEDYKIKENRGKITISMANQKYDIEATSSFPAEPNYDEVPF